MNMIKLRAFAQTLGYFVAGALIIIGLIEAPRFMLFLAFTALFVVIFHAIYDSIRRSMEHEQMLKERQEARERKAAEYEAARANNNPGVNPF